MIKSRYTHVFPLGNDDYVFINVLSGACDVGDNADKQALESAEPRTIHESQKWIQRGYLFDSLVSEERYIAERYTQFLETNAQNETQFLLVPSYGCNFNCDYCYQKGIKSESQVMSPEMLTAFVQFVVNYREQEKRSVMVTLFGGEPLLPSHRQRVSELVRAMNHENIPLSVVTNGYYLADYIDVLMQATIREVHVTLDGDRDEHNRRRRTRDGKDSFDRIINGLQQAHQAGFPLNIRIILDRKTLQTLPRLAQQLEQAGFFNLPRGEFKTSLGRNYELINNYLKPEDLFTLDELYREYTQLLIHEPILKKLHVPSFFGITQLVTHHEMYLPAFDTCPAAKSEYVFDASGRIFGCTASTGRETYDIGTYYPQVSWNNEALKLWRNRNILTIPECRNCSVGVVCGGGCGVIAKENNGKVLTPNCKPIWEVMAEGICYYSDYFLSFIKKGEAV